jgi:hypothetical protein
VIRHVSFLIRFPVGFLWCRLSPKKSKAEKDPNKPKHPQAPSLSSCKSPDLRAVLRFVLILWCVSCSHSCFGVFSVLQGAVQEGLQGEAAQQQAALCGKHCFNSICVLLFVRVAVILVVNTAF